MFTPTSPLERIHAATNTRTQTELAALLNIRQSSISDAKRRNAIPSDWLVKLLRTRGLNPEWILTGQGSQYLGPVDGEAVIPVAPAIEPEPQAMDSAAETLLKAAMIISQAAGMFSENMQRQVEGKSMAYDDDAFCWVTQKILRGEDE